MRLILIFLILLKCSVLLAQKPDFTISVENVNSTAYNNGFIYYSYSLINNTPIPATQNYIFVDIYLSFNEKLDDSDVLLRTNSHTGTLTAPYQNTFTFQAQLPDTADGEYYIFFVADNQNQVEEENEDNNGTSPYPIVVKKGTIDLILSYVNSQPDYLVRSSGSVNRTSLRIQNTGTSGVPPGLMVHFFISEDHLLDDTDILVDSMETYSYLMPDVPRDYTVYINIPSYVPVGKYFLVAVVDYVGKFEETNELNQETYSPEKVIDNADLIVLDGHTESTGCMGIIVDNGGYIPDTRYTINRQDIIDIHPVDEDHYIELNPELIGYETMGYDFQEGEFEYVNVSGTEHGDFRFWDYSYNYQTSNSRSVISSRQDGSLTLEHATLLSEPFTSGSFNQFESQNVGFVFTYCCRHRSLVEVEDFMLDGKRYANSEPIQPGANFNFDVVYKNNGSVASLGNTVRFSVSSSWHIKDTFALLGVDAFTALSPGESDTLKLNFTLPQELTAGFYYLFLEYDLDFCRTAERLFTLEVATVTSQKIKSDNQKITIAPNPAKDFIFVKGVKGLGYILDVNGRPISCTEISEGKQISTSGLPAGIYLLKVHSSDGVFVKRFSIH